MKKNNIYLILIISAAVLLVVVFFAYQLSVLRNIANLFSKKQEPKIVYKAEDTIKILEGWTNQDIADYFAKNGKWSAAAVLNVTDSASSTLAYSKKFSFLDQKETPKSLEGYLFPDTYRVFASSTIDEVLVKMLDNFDNKLTLQMRSDIKAQGKSISEIVIMASIIEKEAPFYGKDNSDAKIVSGIFWNRLANKQALQSDATLSFIFKDNKPTHEGNDLNNSSPYNTYKYRGLPPGPICNPGLLALEAAIYPEHSNYNYFLTAPDGNIYYAKTYAEHLQNKYKYLK
jgi:UPF0755 protein